jgi:tRNA dimethylallyltransferase
MDGRDVILPDPERLFFVCGPTASGKSARALEIAREHDGEIVNADAFQLYRGVEILTAAPSTAERLEIPHHLYGVLAPSDPIDAMAYLRLVVPVIGELLARGKTPVITGGSGLYLKFLSHGPSPLPPGEPALRAELDALPLDALVARLRDLDPAEAARTDLHNRRYVSRALEVCLLAGVPCSTLRDDWEAATAARAARLRGIVLQRPRPELHERIARRTRLMLDGGAIEEVAALGEIAPGLEKAIGLREIRQLLAGEIDRPACEELINAATRQYAKRQGTWFRREAWLEPEVPVPPLA